MIKASTFVSNKHWNKHTI